MATLAQLRARLNDEIGVASDAETAPWSTARRNQAIADAYAALWRVGVWKDAKQDLTTVTNQYVYALTSIRKLNRLELLDSSSRVVEHPKGIVEPDGAGAGTYQLILTSPIASGYTLRVRGWAPYASTFAGESSTDDLPAEHSRLPLLKAKAILYRQELSRFMRYGESQVLEPGMNISMEGLLAGIAQAEREFADETRLLAAQRPRSSLTGRL